MRVDKKILHLAFARIRARSAPALFALCFAGL
jgi:hypothetical protein